MRCEWVKNPDDWKTLEPQWKALLAESYSNMPFLSFEWLTTWWDCFGRDKSLRFVLLHRNGRLVGIAPLMEITEWAGPLAGLPPGP